VLSELEWYTAAAMMESVPLYSGITQGVVIGSVFDWANAGVVFGFTVLVARRRKL